MANTKRDSGISLWYSVLQMRISRWNIEWKRSYSINGKSIPNYLTCATLTDAVKRLRCRGQKKLLCRLWCVTHTRCVVGDKSESIVYDNGREKGKVDGWTSCGTQIIYVLHFPFMHKPGHCQPRAKNCVSSRGVVIRDMLPLSVRLRWLLKWCMNLLFFGRRSFWL